MNYYIELINKSLDYMEDNITKNISLENISREVNLSAYHFERLFNIIVGKSFKQYILGRKLTLAADKLQNSSDKIIGVALDFGFEYPEVFSRAFKKQFGVPPTIYRSGNYKIKKVQRAEVIARNLVNYSGSVTLQASYIKLEDIRLQGVNVVVNVKDKLFIRKLNKVAEDFVENSKQNKLLKQDRFFSIVNCNGDVENTHTVFFGREIINPIDEGTMVTRIIPSGCYAGFSYEGDMSEVRTTFEEDLLRWIAVKEIKLRPIGIGMITIYDSEYFEKKKIKILVPIQER